MNIKDLTYLFDYQKIGDKMLLVDLPRANFKYVDKVKTEEVVAYTYTVVLEDYGYEKIQIKIEGSTPSFTELDLQGKKAIPVKVTDLQFSPYIRDNNFYFSFKASSILATK